MSDQQSATAPSSIKFLADHPSEEDHFGPHSRVAAAIAAAIERDDAIHVVGLLGGWGSGKSTVVRQIEKLLSCGNGIHFFNYDAWLHQNDPPRRAFLEELIGDLTFADIVKPAEWEPRLAQLAGKAEETRTRTTRQFSETGRAIFLALAFVPLGLGFLDYDLIDKALGTGGYGIARPLLALSLAAVLAPLLVVSYFYLKWRPLAPKGAANRWAALGTKAFWLEHDEAHRGQSVVALLTNYSEEVAHNRTKISPEPTAIEFRTVFNDLLTDCRKKDRRLVIVIDNLDRLAESDAMQLWATIRSLFLVNNKELVGSAGQPPPAIILPIDEAAIQRMFKIQHEEQIAKQLSESFIDKTFDITFQVNEPVMSDWRSYFSAKLEEAFGALATTDRIYWATKIVEETAAGSDASKNMTPRKLIKLINGAGALLAQWGDGAIDLLAMIFYASHRAEIIADVRKFVARGHKAINSAVPDWRRQLLALHFGVAPEKAFQTLLAEPIRAAIAANSHETFESLIAGPGAPDVAEEVLATPPLSDKEGTADGDFVMNATLLLAASSAKEEIWARRSISELSRLWQTAAVPAAWRSEFAEVIALLQPTQDKDAHYIVGNGRILSGMLAKVKLDDQSIEQIALAFRALRTVSLKFNFKSPIIQSDRSIEDLFVILPALDATDRQAFRTTQAASAFIDTLVNRLEAPENADTVPKIVRASAGPQTLQFKDTKKLVWDPLAQAAHDILVVHNFEDERAGPALDTISLLHGRTNLAKSLSDQLFDSGRLVVLADNAYAESDDDRLGDVSALMLLRGNDFAAPNGMEWGDVIAERPKLAGCVNNALTWYLWNNGVSFAIEALPSRPTAAPLIWELVRGDIETNEAGGVSTPFLIGNVDAVENALGPDLLNTALAFVSRRDNFWPSLEGRPFGRQFDRTVRGLAKSDSVDRSRLIELVRTRLENVDTTGWRNAIIEDTAPAGLIVIYRDELHEKKAFGEPLRAALAEQVTSLLQGNGDIRSRWFNFVQFVSKSMRTTLLRHLRDAILSGAEVSNLADLVAAGGESLKLEGKLADEPDKVARHVVQPLVRSSEGRSLILSDAKFYASVLALSDMETRAAVEEYLTEAEVDEATAADMNACLSALGLKGKRRHDKSSELEPRSK